MICRKIFLSKQAFLKNVFSILEGFPFHNLELIIALVYDCTSWLNTISLGKHDFFRGLIIFAQEFQP